MNQPKNLIIIILLILIIAQSTIIILTFSRLSRERLEPQLEGETTREYNSIYHFKCYVIEGEEICISDATILNPN